MSADSKVRIYKTVVRPILTYAVETRADSTKTKNTMRAAEMIILRTIKGVSLRDQIRSEAISEDLKIQDIIRFTRARRRYRRDHSDRMMEDGQRMDDRIQRNLQAELPKDGTKAGHLLPKRLNSRRNKTTS
ncbi:uncharacterized protein LOC123675480 [Harmonia axyridis]|uniref:uncharacterized protein LOC123675480 n=1 Tax=Harmonia axyridis TaxID=115357 RepID=UPI001E278E03|nr:uncharacterized protein LOC123675480 [Harmonia axyridis]